jgi:hypothetical protein
MRYEGYEQDDVRISIYKNIMYILNSSNLRKNIMDEIHEMPYFGHRG